MSARKKFIYLFLVVLILGVVFFRGPVENLFLLSKMKLADFKKNALDALIQHPQTSVSTPPPLRSEKESPNPVLTQAGTFKWTNTNRRDNGLMALQENKKLDEAAMEKAKDILEKQYFEHTSPTGKGPQDLAADVGYDYISIGENLALGNFANDQELLNAWMASPGHRENILRKSYAEIGVAVLMGKYEGQNTWVAVQEFGTPLSDCPAVDASLKKTVDANSARVADLGNTLQTQKDALSKHPSAQQIDEYNSLVKQYNALVVKAKTQIETYNSQVASFNNCIKKYQP